jgi:hypothetical protein
MSHRPDGAGFRPRGAGNPNRMATREPEEEQGVSGAVRAAARGRSDRTPVLAFAGVTLVVGAFAGLLVLVVFLVWLLA